jgi:hypothetical protein
MRKVTLPGYKYRANDFRFDALPAACSKLAANMSDLIGRPTPAFLVDPSCPLVRHTSL